MPDPSYLDSLDKLGYKTELLSGGAYNGLANSVDGVTSLSDLDSGQFAEHLIIAKDGHIRGGQTDWDVGDGFWMGYYPPGKDYRISVGNTTDFFNFDGDQVNISGNVNQQIQVTAGEAITKGDVVCIRTNEIVQTVATHDAKVLESSAGTNFGTATTAVTGSGNGLGTADSYFYVKFDISTVNISTPHLAYIRLDVESATGTLGALYQVSVHEVVDADWDESTITWTNAPGFALATTDKVQFTASSITEEYYLESNLSRNWVFLDVTDLFTAWKDAGGADPNYGVVVRFTLRASSVENAAAAANITINTSEHATVYKRPTLIVVGPSTNAGEAFKAFDFSDTAFIDWTNTFGILGFAKNTAIAGDDVTIQTSGFIDSPSGSPLTVGSTYFVSSNVAGEIEIRPNTFFPTSVGKAVSTTRLLIQFNAPSLTSSEIFLRAGDTTNGSDMTRTLIIPIGFEAREVNFDGFITLDGTSYPAFGTWTLIQSIGNTNSVASRGTTAFVNFTAANLEATMYVNFFDSTKDTTCVRLYTKITDSAAAYNNVDIRGRLTFYR